MDNEFGKCSRGCVVTKAYSRQSSVESRRTMAPAWLQRTVGLVGAVALATGLLHSGTESSSGISSADFNRPGQRLVHQADIIDDIIDIIEEVLGGGEGGGEGGG